MKNKESKSKKQRRCVVYVAAEFRQEDISPLFHLVEREPGLILLHSVYNFENTIGQKTLTELELEAPPKFESYWENVLKQDNWAIQHSDIVVLDLDRLSSLHFAAVAALFDKPVFGVSETLASIPPYFSGAVNSVVKPQSFTKTLHYVAFENKITIPAEDPKPKSKSHKVIDEMLQDSVKKTLDDMNVPIN